MNRKKYKLAEWMKMFWGLLFLSIFTLFVFFAFHLEKNQTKQISENLQDSMSIYINGIDEAFDSIDKYLYISLENSTDLVRIESEQKELHYYIAVQNLYSTMSKILEFNNDISEIVYFYPGKKESKAITASSIGDMANRNELEDFLINRLKDQKEKKDIRIGEYSYYTVGDSVYIVHYYKINHSYFAIGMSTDVIFSSLSALREKEGTEIFLSNNDGLIIDSTNSMIDKLPHESNGQIVTIKNNEYLMSEGKSKEGKFYIGLLTKQDIINEKANQVVKIVIMLFLALVVIYFIGNIVTVNFMILKPLHKITESMKQLKNGNWDFRIKVYSKIQEYCVLEDAFNEMSSEIKELKIQNYEATIKKHKAELQYLQLQVSPHFYLNALNVIYSLAQSKNYQQIQKMTLHLVNYSRYMFHNVQELVTLENELKHIEEYINIQKMRVGDFEWYHVEIEEQLKKLLIPPFSLQGFVENSVKYAMRDSKRNKLTISGRYDKQSKMVSLMVQDTGKGYSQTILDIVNNKKSVEFDTEKNIGIRNVIERLQIIYGNKAELRIYNNNGAVAELRVPLILKA